MYRKCEICGHDDIQTNVYASGSVPVSFNYCEICGVLDALPKFLFEDEYLIGIYYDEETDIYRHSETNNPYTIELENGLEFKTRSEFAEFLKTIKKENQETT